MDEMWLQVVSWVVGGAGITGLVTATVQSRREHKRWLRDQKKDAYAQLLTYASAVRATAIKLANMAAEVDEIQKIYATGNLQAPLELPTLDYPSFKTFGDVHRAREELRKRLNALTEAFKDAMEDSTGWEGTMDLMAPKDVTHALSEFFGSVDGLGDHVLDAHGVKRDISIGYDNLRSAVRSDFGTRNK